MLRPLRKVRDHFFRDIINRISDLETGIRVLVNSPSYDHSDGVGFNGQKGRKRIFLDLVGKYEFSSLIETGTYLGDTAGYMAKTTGLPVFSCERNPSLFSLAKLRLKEIPSVSLYNMDSREFLLSLSDKPEISEKECFLYLDAHWGKAVPLKEEISIIGSRWKKFIIMIDDFQVPDDDGYQYGKYGTLRNINISKLHSDYNLCAFFPAFPSREEYPVAQGCVILTKNDHFAGPLQEISSIKRYRLNE